MTEKIDNIARNTSYFTLALILQKIISLAYFTVYARVLGPADLGQYYFAISITSIFAIFIDFGLGNVLTRETAKHPDKASSYLGTILSAKSILALGTLLVLGIWTWVYGYEPLTLSLIWLSAIAMLADSFTGVFYAILRGFHNLKFESISSVIYQTIVLLLSLFFIARGADVRWIMVSLVVASLFNLVYSSSIVRSKLQLKLAFRWDSVLAKQLFLIALPFAVYAIFQRFYTYFDSVLLFKFAGDAAVGLYQVPFKIIVAVQFLPMAFTASLYPALSAYWHRNREQLAVTFERAISYSLILALPIALGSIALADKIVLIFKEDFASVAWPLQVAMMSVPFMFLGFPVGSLLNACDRQKRNTINMAITSIVSALLNFWLIPIYGVMGAVATNLITAALMLGLGWLVVPEIVSARPRVMLLMVAKTCTAAAIMAIVVYLCKEIVHPIIAIFIAAIVYVVALYGLRGFSKADLTSILASFKRV